MKRLVVRRMVRARCRLLAWLLLVFIPVVHCLGDGRIGLLFIGDLSNAGAFWLTRSDPLFRPTFVPATMRDFMLFCPMPAPTPDDLGRLIRLHMPRTYADVVRNYDVIVFFEANSHAVGSHMQKLANAVSQRGLGLLMEGGYQSFGGNAGHPSWGDTPIGALLPTEDIPGGWHDSLDHRFVVDKPEHEYMRSIPWREETLLRGQVWDHNLLNVRPGAEMLAHVESSGCNSPMMVTWRFGPEGGSRTFSCASEWLWQWVAMPFWKHQYYACTNLVIYLDGRPVPEDLVLVEAARSGILSFATRRSLLLSLFEFCESFGANTDRLTARLEEVEQTAAKGLPQYLNLDFEAALSSYEEAGKMLGRLEIEAMNLKRMALVWVYVVEWLSVSGTAISCGVVIWWIMVRKALYRPVRVTRLTY